ncbi:OmpL47-type beta-barrel domain-containing protein [Arthrobacter sp. NPDC058097]|uniref:OmpL47-type beta-barrel domain-containing protein n=1 Tax=Arthrobacter sp. NPDC058097 TaxID=3346340 RepID=UPI0036DEE365
MNRASCGNAPTLRRRILWTVSAVLFITWGAPAANAFWQTVSSSNFAAAKADTLPQGGTPAASPAGANVSVSWAAVTTPGAHAVAGYTIARYASPTGGAKVDAGGGCAGTVSTLACTEQTVPDGTWYYTATPVIALWTGTASARSAGVTVDVTAPTVSVTSVSPAPNGASFNNSTPVTVNLGAVDNPGGTGVAAIKYTVDGGSMVVVNAATAAVNVSGNGTHTVSFFATDAAGNSGAPQTQTIRIDTVPPAIPTISTPVYVNIANVANVPITGTAEAGASVVLTVTDSGAHTVTQTVSANGSGSWSAAGLSLTSLNDGLLSYSAVARDAAGNTGQPVGASSTKDVAAPTVSSIIQANNGGTGQQGRASNGDTLTMVYSADTAASTLCSSWSNSAATASATGTASISSDDTMTFTGASCSTPAIGSVKLIANYNSHLTLARSYAATVTWTKSTGTLVLTLNDGGTGGTRGDDSTLVAPVYTPATGVADTAGNLMTGTFTAATLSGF